MNRVASVGWQSVADMSLNFYDILKEELLILKEVDKVNGENGFPPYRLV
jgi:hypothetical protein